MQDARHRSSERKKEKNTTVVTETENGGKPTNTQTSGYPSQTHATFLHPQTDQ